MKLKTMFPIMALLCISLAGCNNKDENTVKKPAITSIGPVDKITGVPRNSGVAITFSEAMDPLPLNTTTFTLFQGTTAVAGTVTYSGTTATFTPTEPLAPGTLYPATV